jgi:hypothetical protein
MTHNYSHILHQEAENAAENPTTSEILVVIVDPGKAPYKLMIPNELNVFNTLVGGYIEIVTIRYGFEKSIAITLNEEGKLLNLPFNRRIVNFDVLVGTFFITAYNVYGNNISLTEAEAEFYIKRFLGTEVIL